MDNLEHNTFIEDDTGHGHKPETPLPIVKRQVTEPQLPPASVPQSTTAAQAKIDAVAALTHSAYQKASQLSLTDAEIAALTADFPDEAFKPGAAGKENLIYIEHAFLRDRLNSVFRPGQWAIVPRSRWAEDFTTRKGDQASRVYVEAMLCIRGCFAAEAVGEMEYYPSNAGQNYGDAVEGAKTAALRRCCKELGIGLQAWKKDWCDGWWQRRRNGFKPSTPVQTPQTPKNATSAPSRPNGGQREATEATRQWMLKALEDMFGDEAVHEYAVKSGILLDSENNSDWPLYKVPTSVPALEMLKTAMRLFFDGGEPPKETPSAGTRNADEEADDVPYDPEEWRSFPMPFGKHAGIKLEDLDKKYLYGLWANYVVEKEFNGKPKKPETIQKDRQFRAYLDDLGKHYEFTKKD